MCSEDNDIREIKQLWSAARFYYSLLPNNIDEAEMNKSVRECSNEFEKLDMTPLFIYSCHLASCAIRLYSIDEKRCHKRYEDYQRWWRNKEYAHEFCNKNTGHIIHCVLRNIVAHNEKMGKAKKNYIEAKEYYLGLRVIDIYKGMIDVVNSIAQDLRLGTKGTAILVESFA